MPTVPITISQGCSGVSMCNTYGAFVDCTKKVTQGSKTCFSIQIYTVKDHLRADLSIFEKITVIVKDIGRNVVAIASDPVLIGSNLDLPLTRTSDGKIEFCIPGNLTDDTLTGKLETSILLEEYLGSAEDEPTRYAIDCLNIGTIASNPFESII